MAYKFNPFTGTFDYYDDSVPKLDDCGTPDDNTDLNFSTSLHGLVPKGTNVGDFLKDDGTWDTPSSEASGGFTAAGFRVYLSGAQTVSAESWETVEFDTEEYDIHGDFNTSTYTFVVPWDGYYQFNLRGHLVTVDATKAAAVRIRNNDTDTLAYANTYRSANGDLRCNVSCAVYLEADDEITAEIYNEDDDARATGTTVGSMGFEGHCLNTEAQTSVLLGDTIAGRVLRISYIKIENGTDANTVKCTVTSSWNGDDIAAQDNISKGTTTGYYTLDGDGDELQIAVGAFSGNILHALGVVVSTAGNDVFYANVRTDGASGLAIGFKDEAGSPVDITAISDVGVTYIKWIYITDDGDTTYYPVQADQGRRVLRQGYVIIEDATDPTGVKATVGTTYQGDTIAATDDITKGSTVGDFSLNAGGTQLRIEATGLSGNVITCWGGFLNNKTGTDCHVSVYPESNGIRIQLNSNPAGVAQDMTSIITGTDTANVWFCYLTDA